MTPDLPTRAREAFYATYNAALPDNTSPEDHDAATDTALAAVIAVVQEDRTREIVAWLRAPSQIDEDSPSWRVAKAEAREICDCLAGELEAKFGGTTR